MQNLFARFFSGTAHVRPFYYFVVQFPLEFLPWSLLWPWVEMHAWRACKRDSAATARDGTRWLLVWVGVCTIFFSFSAGKRGLYLLPTYPAVAILCGVAIDEFLERRSRLPFAASAALAGLAMAALGLGALVWNNEGMSLPAYPAFDREKSPRPISRAAAALSRTGSPTGVFDQKALAGGVAYYSGRRVVHLHSEQSLRDFLDGGGRNIIVKQTKVARVPRVTRVEVRASSRSGARKLVVISPAQTSPPPVAALATPRP